MCHIQGPTPIQSVNSVTKCIVADRCLQCWSKAINLHFYWICNWCQKIISCSLETSKAQFLRISITTSFYTKSHYNSTNLCTQYHSKTNKTIFKSTKLPKTLQSCVQTHLLSTIKQPLVHKSLTLPAPVGPIFDQNCYSHNNLSTFPNLTYVKDLPFK